MNGVSRGMLLGLWLGLIGLGVVAGPARAQTDLLGGGTGPVTRGEVGIVIESVGLSNAARPGEWTGIRVRLTDRGERQREVLVRVALTDADGDTAQYDTVVTTNPGVEQPVWTYARLPFDIATVGGFEVRAFEAEEATESGAPGVAFVPGRLLGEAAQPWPGNTSAMTGFIGVVGLNPGGIAGYQQQEPGTDSNPLGHEAARLVPMRPDSIPDRWLGLAMLREIVWNGVSPSELRIEQVRALREWVERGGHLVVVLPPVGQDWLAISNPELANMLPVVTVTRLESEPLSSLRPLLTDSETLVLTEEPVTVHVFEARAEAEPGQADIILTDPAGRGVVVSRAVGVGAVTLIGLPVWQPTMLRQGVPEADVFWHRVLGRRGQVATDAEFEQMRKSLDYVPGNRPSVRFDLDIASWIDKSGRSLAGVMLGLVVFIGYWAVAGPGGYALLKKRGLTRHAWLAFFVASMVFTGLAWGGATLLRPKRVEISHLSFLDHVYGQRVQRVRSWVSVLLPVYGDATVSLESDDAGPAGSRFVQAVAPWSPPPSAALGGRGSFPDSRSYSVNSRSPDSLTFPARATVKQLQLDWAGGIPWDSIRPVVAEGEDPFRAVRFVEGGGRTSLEGRLVHNLPGTLTDVQVILFRRQIPVRGSLSKDFLLTTTNAWVPQPADWAPGGTLDLGAVTGVPSANVTAKLDSLVGSGFGSDGLPSPAQGTDRLEWLAFFNLLGPPTYTRGGAYGPRLARRESTHGLDLSRWSTRPCLVVIGRLQVSGMDSTPAPVRVSTNGAPRQAYSSGTTIIRWVYPLPANPPEVPADAPAGGEGR